MVDISDRSKVFLRLHSAMLRQLMEDNLVMSVNFCMYQFMGYGIVVDDTCPDWEFCPKSL